MLILENKKAKKKKKKMRQKGENPSQNLYIKPAKPKIRPNHSTLNLLIFSDPQRSNSFSTMADESSSAKRWLPLEANPEVMNQVSLSSFLFPFL